MGNDIARNGILAGQEIVNVVHIVVSWHKLRDCLPCVRELDSNMGLITFTSLHRRYKR
jgi:hypothetical protein